MTITTPVLDDFNAGASQNLRSATRAGWAATGVYNFNGALATDAVPTTAINANADAAWGTIFGADQQVWVTYAAWSNVQAQSIMARIATLNTGGATCYRITKTSSTDNWFMTKLIAGADTPIGSGWTQAITVGDSMGLECIGSQISAYYKAGAAAWVQKATVSDSSITAGGSIGIDNYTTLITYDAFGGGELLAGAPARDTHTAIPFTQGAGGGAFGGGGPH